MCFTINLIVGDTTTVVVVAAAAATTTTTTTTTKTTSPVFIVNTMNIHQDNRYFKIVFYLLYI